MLDRSRSGSSHRGSIRAGRHGLSADGVSREEFLKLSGAAGLFVAGSGGVVAALGGQAGAQSTGGKGSFSAPFAEPTIDGTPDGTRTSNKCIKRADGTWQCKPAAGSVALLPDGRFLYFNALEGTENIELTILTEIDEAFVNDQTRVLTLGNGDEPSWERPEPVDGGANPDGNDSTFLLPEILVTDDDKNDGALFCADLVHLPDGSIIAVGGTDYYEEANIVELEGLRNSRVFNPADETWRQTGSMNFGRWYPTIVTLANNDIFVSSGVTKLIKPVYPEDPQQSGRNVVQTETFNINNGQWTENSEAAQRSLPLFPRNHLLPNGHVLYNAGGQAFNPFGQAYDQALWNIVGAYDPQADAWSDVGYAGFPLELNETGLEQISAELEGDEDDDSDGGLLGGAVDGLTGALRNLLGERAEDQQDLASKLGDALGESVDPTRAASAAGTGFRGSTFSIMMPLEADDNGNYNEAEFLTAGGVLGAVVLNSPGTYVGTPFSRIDTLSTGGEDIGYVSRLTGPMNNRRWYPTGVLLPTGEVMAFSGGDRDGVVAPGLDRPIKQAELFDPESETWKPMASGNNPRTYHNTAILMPDGRVLVGGHAPISTAYLNNTNLEEAGFSPNDGRDPSFEIYSPPYVSEERPTISNSTDQPRPVSLGQSLPIQTPDAADIESVMLVRRTTLTHLVDGDQRAVKLPFEASGNRITAQMPESPAVAPAGQYLVFVNRQGDNGLVPSVAMPVQIPLES